MRRSRDRYDDVEPSSPPQSSPDYTIVIRGYNFREGQPLSWSAIQLVSGRVIHCSLGLNLCATSLDCIAVPKPTVTCSMTANGTPRTIIYRVFVQGEWTVVPDDAILSGPNKFGKAIVWFKNPWGVPDTRIQCFLPGSGV